MTLAAPSQPERADWRIEAEVFETLESAAIHSSHDKHTQVACMARGWSVPASWRPVLSAHVNRNQFIDLSKRPERLERPEKYRWTPHAEENLVAMAARVGRSLFGSTVYLWASRPFCPCAPCVRMLATAGVSQVIVYDMVDLDNVEDVDEERYGFSVTRQLSIESGMPIIEWEHRDKKRG